MCECFICMLYADVHAQCPEFLFSYVLVCSGSYVRAKISAHRGSAREAKTRSHWVNQCSCMMGMLTNFVHILVYYTSCWSIAISFTYFEILDASQMCSDACYILDICSNTKFFTYFQILDFHILCSTTSFTIVFKYFIVNVCSNY